MRPRRSLALAVAASLLLPGLDGQARSPAPPIDRQALVTRHNPRLASFDPRSPLSVGNGEFAFTADATGLQTFAEAFAETTPSAPGKHAPGFPEGFTVRREGLTVAP